MHLLYPLALFGLLAVPALVAIYWLRNRSRVVPVSSLMLWLDQSEIQHGGVRLRRLQTPLLFYLELAALVLLALAAAGPQIRTAASSQSLIVILDNSYSMLAGGSKSPRQRGLDALRTEIATGNWYAVRCLIAGTSPTLLETPELGSVVDAIDRKWTCQAPHADIDNAVNLAAELGGKHSAILVLSDHKPALELPEGRVRWWSFGEPRGNIAIINAARSTQPDSERLLLEIANYADKPRSTQLLITDEAGKIPLQRSKLDLEPREIRRLTLKLDDSISVVRAKVVDDVLATDNEVALTSTRDRPVRVQVSSADDKLRPLIERVLDASKRATLTENAPDLIITDGSRSIDREKSPAAWVLRFVVEKDAEAYVGPFVMDRAHPLNEGLALNGVIWGAGKTSKAPGTPVISVGNTPLVSDVETPSGEHEIQFRLRHDLSTLAESPQWAVLIWNLLHWRTSQLDGLVRSNVRLGEPAVLKTWGEGVWLVEYPDGTTEKKNAVGRRLSLTTDQVGICRLTGDKTAYRFAANALHPEESDLKNCVTGTWGEWKTEAGPTSGLETVSWLLALLVALLLTMHLWLARRAGF